MLNSLDSCWQTRVRERERTDEQDDSDDGVVETEQQELDCRLAAAQYFQDCQPAAGGGAACSADAEFCCGCTKKCMENMDKNLVQQTQLNFVEMEKSEQDMIILGMLEASQFKKEKTARGSERARTRFRYSFAGHEICLTAFRQVYNIGTKRFDNLRKYLEEHGAVPRVHKTKGRKAHNAFPFATVENVVIFLKAFAERYGTPHPAPLHGRSAMPPTYLPSSNTKHTIHLQYVESCRDSDVQSVG